MAFRQQKIRANLERRARLLAAVRAFFQSADYLEVETPVRIPAPAPEAHIDPEAADGWYLHTSPELAMKRLLAAGFPRIFQICRCFRKGERGRWHLPEFTLLEWYTAHEDYRHMMAQTEALVCYAVTQLTGGRQLVYQVPGHTDPSGKGIGSSQSPFGFERQFFILPQAVPALTAVSLFHFFFAWNNFFDPLIYLAGNRDIVPISVGLNFFNGTYDTDPNLIMAASFIALIIPLIIFFFSQRVFLSGIVVSGADK